MQRLTEEDKKYLETFENLECLAFNSTHLSTLENFPELKNLIRLELAENNLKGDDLQHLKKYALKLETLKLAANKIDKLEDLNHLEQLKNLKNLDIGEN